MIRFTGSLSVALPVGACDAWENATMLLYLYNWQRAS